MILQSSSKSLEVLTLFAKEAFCGRSINDGGGDILEVEAGKVLSEICTSDHIEVQVNKNMNGVSILIELPNKVQDVDKSMDEVSSKDDSQVKAMLQKENEELKEINAELMKQFEKLRHDKERLEQQVAVLSEGSSYI